MTISYVNLGDQLVNVRQICPQAPIPTVCRAYSRALREWCQQTWWLRLSVGGQTQVTTRDYSLGSDDNLDISAIRAMSVMQLDGTICGMEASDSTQWNLNLKPTIPRRYCYVPEGKFAVDPEPDAVYNLTVSVVVMPKERATQTAQIPVDPLIKYSNDIEAGALAYLMSMPGQPWSNAGQALLYDKKFQAAIANGKAEVQRAFNQGSMRARPRPFGTLYGA
jgi:hypothetical protein